MRAIIQRVKSASVSVDGNIISKIGPGLMCLIGISQDDTPDDRDYISRKILNLRLFKNEENGRNWDKSVVDISGEILLVSQFTLYGVLKGNRVDFHLAMSPDPAKKFYDEFIGEMKKKYKEHAIKDGVFGAYMEVNIHMFTLTKCSQLMFDSVIDICNDGPVTIPLDSRKGESLKEDSK